jgi:hypothetical protein
MKRTLVIAGLAFVPLVSVGLVWLAVKEQQRQVRTTPATPLFAEPANPADVTGKTVDAAQAFLATLDDAKRTKVSFAFDSDQKSKWSNFPAGIYPRNGLRLGDLNDAQRNAVLRLLAVALSQRGLVKVTEIMEGDEVLKTAAAGRGDPQFGRDNYYIALLGTPSLTDPWMIQFGGHHLAINVTIFGKANVMTPSLPAAQPASYQLKSETVRPLGRENDKGFELINSLDASQQKQAILTYQVNDLVLGAGQDGKTAQPEGIKVSAFNDAQKQKLLDLVSEWVGILNDEAAAVKMAEVRANLAETWFAWSGPTTNGSPAYFRIQGPTLWIEYSPQRMRGSGLDVNHIHTIYRDPTNDYGARLVKR